LCVVVELVDGVVLVVCGVLVVEEEEELPPPHAASAIVLARRAASVSMAVSGVVLIGRAPIVARGLGDGPHYQAFAA
jgi:uncharacterized membrane protein